jgi:RES domain-containing protein
MTIYRITNSMFKDDISGQGAKLYGGRWNIPGYPALYTSEHISLCVLEMLVNISFPESQFNFHLLQLNIPDSFEPAIIAKKKLKASWQDDMHYTRFMGTEFLKNERSLVLKMPSAVVSEENNYLLNPLHKEFKRVTITNSYPFKFDKRLLSF